LRSELVICVYYKIDKVRVHLRPEDSASNRFRQPLTLQDIVIPQHPRRTTVFEVDEKFILGKSLVLFSEQVLTNIIPRREVFIPCIPIVFEEYHPHQEAGESIC